MKSTRGSPVKPIFIILALLTLYLLLAGSLVRVEVLVVESSNGTSIIYGTPRTITIEYVHSVEKGKIVEILEARDGCIRLESLIWQGYGAGMPSSLHDIKGDLESHEGLYEARIGRCLGRSIIVNLDYMIQGGMMVNGLHFTSGVYSLRLCEKTLLEMLLDKVDEVLSGIFIRSRLEIALLGGLC
jgi:hypothetical protein